MEFDTKTTCLHGHQEGNQSPVSKQENEPHTLCRKECVDQARLSMRGTMQRTSYPFRSPYAKYSYPLCMNQENFLIVHDRFNFCQQISVDRFFLFICFASFRPFDG